jgi:tyrosine ammonia-lyase
MKTMDYVISLMEVLTCQNLEQAVRAEALTITFSPETIQNIEKAYAAFERIIGRGDAVYGVTTGFGPLVQHGVEGASAQAAQGIGLIAHLGAGFGAPVEPEIVRAAMLLRLQTLALGYSGVSLPAVQFYATMLERGIVPSVPSIGSLGASGDLIPLAHIVRAMTGEGDALQGLGTIPAREALQKAGLEPYHIAARDALGLVNGTSFSAAYAALALVRLQRLVRRSEELTAWQMTLLDARVNSLDARLHTAKGHAGQIESAASIRQHCAIFNHSENTERPLQEVYSLRCAPQILGAVRDTETAALLLIQQEMSGADDNPLVDVETETVLHGGNFMTQHIAFAADMVNSACTQTANLAERQTALLMESHTNGGASLLLAWTPGKTSGMAGVQLTATALVAEMRSRAQAYAASTLPTNAGNQDIVPMGFQAARECYGQTERLAAVLACQALSLAQLAHWQREMSGRDSPLPAWLRDWQPVRTDRAMREDIAWLTSLLLDVTLL